MSSEAGGSDEATESAVSREVAWRTSAREYNDADLAFKGGDDERAPNYVATPTGAKINRLFAVGVLTEVERVGDGGLLRARVSDPTGAFVVYAGQYQPDAVSFFADAETPSFIAVVGKARTYEPEDSDDVYTSIRPEEVNVVDSETRDRWNVETARETLKRVDAVREYIRTGMTPETTPALHELGEVLDHYGTDEAYLNEIEREAREVLTEIAGVEAGAGPEATGTAEETAPADTETTETPEEADTDAPADDAEETAETEASEPQTAQASEAVETEAAEADVGTEGDEPTSADDTAETAPSETTEEFDDIEQEEVGEWEWDEEEREEVKEEFGAEFESGAEIAEDEEDEFEEEAESDTAETSPEPPGGEDDEDEEDEAPAEEEEQSGTEDAQESAESVVMGIIEEENGDKGAERSTIIEKAADRGIDEDVAEDTLEDLLLEGMCYPTDGDRIKPL